MVLLLREPMVSNLSKTTPRRGCSRRKVCLSTAHNETRDSRPLFYLPIHPGHVPPARANRGKIGTCPPSGNW
jgi:hypothetical protein